MIKFYKAIKDLGPFIGVGEIWMLFDGNIYRPNNLKRSRREQIPLSIEMSVFDDRGEGFEKYFEELTDVEEAPDVLSHYQEYIRAEIGKCEGEIAKLESAISQWRDKIKEFNSKGENMFDAYEEFCRIRDE